MMVLEALSRHRDLFLGHQDGDEGPDRWVSLANGSPVPRGTLIYFANSLFAIGRVAFRDILENWVFWSPVGCFDVACCFGMLSVGMLF